jgi:CubicO group peptidase (beta-lactamase class C family)
LTDLDALLRTSAAGLAVPGAAVAVLDGSNVTTAAYGVTNVEHPLEVDDKTLFQIGSITKTFTGTAAMRLVERRALDLDEPVRTYLPGLRMRDPEVASRVTVRHLLTHTGGWVGDYFEDTGGGDDAIERMVEQLADVPQETPLGELWAYNNSGFYIAGRVIEVVTEMPFDRALRELVLEPLGLEHTFWTAEEVITHRFAVGHDREGKVARPWGLARAAQPAGSLVSSVLELTRYARFHLGDGEGVLSRESLDRMREPQLSVGGVADWVGLTWYGEEHDGLTFVGHGGGTNGQISRFDICPAENWGFAMVTNHQDGGELIRAVRNALLAERFGIEMTEPQAIEPTAEQIEEVVGRYEAALGIFELGLEEGRLTGHVHSKGGFPKRDSPPGPDPPPFAVGLLADGRMSILDGPAKGLTGEFLRDADERILWLRFGGRLHRRTEAR